MQEKKITPVKRTESKEEIIELLDFLHNESKLPWRDIANHIGVDYTVIMKWKKNGSWGAVMGVRILTLAKENGFKPLNQQVEKINEK